MKVSGLPKVSVLMPVYNGGSYLAEAIRSILEQTFTDFELLVIDDGSKDESYKIAAEISDDRIRLIRQDKNLGLVAALNLGLGLSRGKYIARMDADDISLPERLSRQVDFMDTNPDVGICGSWLQTFSDEKPVVWSLPLSHSKIHVRLLFQSALFHPTVFIRKSTIDAQSLCYSSDYPHAEDYELWSRSLAYCRLANIGEALLHYRIHANSIGSLEPDSKQHSADKIRLRWLNSIGLHPTEEEMILHRQLSLGLVPIQVSIEFLEQSHTWLLKIIYANRVTQTFPEPELAEELSSRWFLICNRSTALGPTVIVRFLNSPLSQFFSGKKIPVIVLAVKSILHWYRRQVP